MSTMLLQQTPHSSQSLRATLLAVALGTSLCGGAAVAQPPIPVRELAPAIAKSAQHFGTILSVRPQANNGVLLDDGGHRRVLALDSMLTLRAVVIDSANVGGQSYGPFATPLVPYRADSSLFVDGASASLLVVSPAGNIARVMSAPKATDMGYLSFTGSGVDKQGNLVYLGGAPPNKVNPALPAIVQFMLQQPDSVPVVRANFETRAVDTVGQLKRSTQQRVKTETEGGRDAVTLSINPLTSIDEWALLSDGTIAIVRGHDYHVDFIHADGTRTSSPKLPFDWKRVTDADKLALIDSARNARTKQDSVAKAAGTTATVALAPDGTRIRMRGSSTSAPATPPMIIKYDYVPLTDIVDYWPPIRSGAAKADLDGNLWILPTTSAQSKNGELVYDVVNNRGEMKERVRLPVGKSIAGFGHNSAVYLMSKDSDGWVLERSRVIRGRN